MPIHAEPLMPKKAPETRHSLVPHAGTGRGRSRSEPEDRKLVFVLGSIGFEVPTKSREHSLGQLDRDGTVDSAEELLLLLIDHSGAAADLSWTLDVEGRPAYVVEPAGAHAGQVYHRLVRLALEQMRGEIDRISLAGHLTGRLRHLSSGQLVPEVRPNLRGLFGWSIERQVGGLLGHLENDSEAGPADASILSSTFERLHRRHGSLGRRPWERAVSYMLTNPFLLGHAVSGAANRGFRLAGVHVGSSENAPPAQVGGPQEVELTLVFLAPGAAGEIPAAETHRLRVDVGDVVPVMMPQGSGEAENPRPMTYHRTQVPAPSFLESQIHPDTGHGGDVERDEENGAST